MSHSTIERYSQIQVRHAISLKIRRELMTWRKSNITLLGLEVRLEQHGGARN